LYCIIYDIDANTRAREHSMKYPKTGAPPEELS